jgi:hypothetical protein
MRERNPANNSSGSSKPAVLSGGPGGSGVANLDNLIYYIDNHVDYFTADWHGRKENL